MPLGRYLQRIAYRDAARCDVSEANHLTTLGSADQLVQVFASVFGLDEPDIAACWPRILARHEQLFGTD